MIIRDLLADDIPSLIAMLREFHERFDYVGKRPVDDEAARAGFSQFVDHSSAAAIVAEHEGEILACLGFVILMHPWNGLKIFYKAFWYSRPNAPHRIGIQLLHYVIDICRAAGVAQINVGSMSKRIDRLLEREGFRPSETNYLLEL